MLVTLRRPSAPSFAAPAAMQAPPAPVVILSDDAAAGDEDGGYLTVAGEANFTRRQLALRLAMCPKAVARHVDGAEGIARSTIGWLNDSLVHALELYLASQFLSAAHATRVVILDPLFTTAICDERISPPTPNALLKRLGGSLIGRCVLFIVCIESHWLLGAVRAYRSVRGTATAAAAAEHTGELCFYDSFRLTGECHARYTNAMGVPLLGTAQRIVRHLSNADDTIRACRWQYTLGQLPVQRNTVDCGVHALMGLADLLRCGCQVDGPLAGFPFTFNADQVIHARRFWAAELLRYATYVAPSRDSDAKSSDDLMVISPPPPQQQQRRRSSASGSPTNSKPSRGASSPRDVISALEVLSNLENLVAKPASGGSGGGGGGAQYASLCEALAHSCVRADDIFRTAAQQGGWRAYGSTDVELLEALERNTARPAWRINLLEQDGAPVLYRARYSRGLVLALVSRGGGGGGGRAFSVLVELDLEKRVIALPTLPNDCKAWWCGRQYLISEPHKWLRPEAWPDTALLEFRLRDALYRFELIRE